MQLAWVVLAGAALAWLYLAAFHVLLCGRHAPRLALLPAIAVFIAGTSLLLLSMWALAEGRFERFAAALAGFAVARVLLDRRMDEAELREGGLTPARDALREEPLDRLA